MSIAAKVAAKAAEHRAEEKRYLDSLDRMERSWAGRTLTEAQAATLRIVRGLAVYHGDEADEHERAHAWAVRMDAIAAEVSAELAHGGAA